RGLAHGDPDVAGVRVRKDQVQGRVGLGQEDRVGRFEADVAQGAGRGVDVEVVAPAGGADVGAGAVGVDVDGPADDVGGAVAVGALVAAHAVLAAVEDRAFHGAEGHVGGGLDQIDAHAAEQVVEEDAAGGRGGQVVRRQDAHAEVAIDVDLQEVG